MKTIGERIRQARDARKMSAHDLALAVGYKTQSGISNLENKATGTGGHKLKDIARVLNVTVDWLMNGPDSDDVPSRPPLIVQGAREDVEFVRDAIDDHLHSVERVVLSDWPFTLFNQADWMLLSQRDREEFENLIAGAVLRARKMRGNG